MPVEEFFARVVPARPGAAFFGRVINAEDGSSY
jgi:hypothetical protein